MPILRLTDLSVQSLKPGLYFDDGLPSFGIRVGIKRKTWLVVKQPNRTKQTIGHYPSLSLREARRRAQVALGTPHQPRDIPAFPDALTEFLAQPDRWRAKPHYNLEKALRKHFTWTKILDKITHQDVLAAIEAIETPGARSNAIKEIRTFFNWCVPRYLAISPCVGLKMPTYKPKQRVLSDDELKRVWIAAEQIGYSFGTIVMLLILTGQRRNEIASLQKGWIHEDRITLPGEVTKNGREHTVPISTLTASIIGSVLMLTERPKIGMLFQAHGKPEHLFSGWSKSLKNLQKKSQTSNWSLHDLRRTFATNLAALGVPIHVTEKLLNHVSGTTGGLVGVYQVHQYWPEQVAAVQKWETRLRSIVG